MFQTNAAKEQSALRFWMLKGAKTPNQIAKRALVVSSAFTFTLVGVIAITVRSTTDIRNFRDLATALQRLGKTIRTRYGLNPLRTSEKEEEEREKWILEAEGLSVDENEELEGGGGRDRLRFPTDNEASDACPRNEAASEG